MTAQAAMTQQSWRARSDASTEDVAPTFINAQDTNFTANCFFGNNYTFRIRFLIQAAGSGASSANNFPLLYSYNTGTYVSAKTPVTVVGPNTSISSDTEGTAIAVSRLTGGTGSFSSGKYSVSANVLTLTLGVSNNTEVEYGITIFSGAVANGATIDFKVHRGTGPTLLTTYTVTPRVTISKELGVGILTGTSMGPPYF